MNVKTTTQLREACALVKSQGIKIVRGPWFVYEGDKIVACCATGAVLIANNKVSVKPTDLSSPGFMKMACEILGIDGRWLYRFFMGFDRGYQVTLILEDKESKKKTEVKDDVSEFGIQLWKECSR